MSKKGIVSLIVGVLLAALTVAAAIFIVKATNDNNVEKEKHNDVTSTVEPTIEPTPSTTEITTTPTTNQTEEVVNKYTVVWKNEDGTILETDLDVEEGSTPTYDGESPKKDNTSEYSYSFSGWNKEITVVNSDQEYIATYSETINKYTVTWENYDGSVLKTEELVYGSTPQYSGSTPTRNNTAQYTYLFSKWDKEIKTVTGNVVYTAQYTETVNTYKVTWKNYDGSVLKTDFNLPYGTTPIYNGTPTKPTDGINYFVFNGWSPVISTVSGDMEYTASYIESQIPYYTIRFKNYNGDILSTIEVKEGEMPEYNDTPLKPKDDNYTYSFTGWSPALSVAIENIDYVAEFESEDLPYSITINLDGGTSETTKLSYKTDSADEIVLPFDVTKSGYRFIGYKLNDDVVYDENGDIVNTYNLSSNMEFIANYVESIVLTINSTLYNPDTHELIETYENSNNILCNVTGSGEFKHRTAVPVSVTPNDGYTFIAYYSSNNTVVSYESSFDVNMWEEDLTLEARFEYTKYDLTISTYNSELGNVLILGDNSFAFKNTQTESIYNTKEVTIIAHSKTDHEFLGWYDNNNNLISDEETYTFNMPKNDYDLIAKWNYFNISYVLNGGTNHPNNPSYYTSPNNVILRKPTKNGYTFVEWQYNSNTITTINSSLLVDVEVTAIWTYYTLTTEINNSNAGSTTIYTNEKITYNTQVTLTATTNEGYRFIGWSDGTSIVNISSSFIFNMPNHDVYYMATWEKKNTYSVKHYKENLNNDNYTLAITETFYGEPGTTTSATTKNYDGYNIPSVTQKTVQANDQTVVNIYYTLIRSDLTVINSDSTGGKVSISTESGYITNYNETFKYGKEITLTATPTLGYEFLGWYSNNLVVDSGLSYIITIGSSDISLEARWNMVDNLALFNCTQLGDDIIIHSVKDKTVTDLIISNNVTRIDEGALAGCSNLKTLSIPFIGDMDREKSDPNLKTFGYIFGKTSYTNSYKANQFEDNNNVDYYIPKSLYKVTMTGGKTVPNGAFNYCKSLVSLTISDTVTNVAYHPFMMCDNLKEIYRLSNVSLAFDDPNNAPVIHNTLEDSIIVEEDGFVFSYYNNKGTLEYYCGSDSNVVLPNSFTYNETLINNYEIGRYTFENYTFNSITLSDSVTFINGYAFSGVTIVNYNSYDNAYYIGSTNNPYMLLYVAKDTNITSCTINPNCITININAFFYCSKMTSVTLNDGLKVIGCQAFCSCSSLTTINLPSSITIIDDIAFEGCSSLQSLTLPNGLKEVRLMLVENCSNLEYLYIPNSITRIYLNAFYNCPKLTAIHYGGTVSEWNTFASENNGWNINSSITKVICTDGEVSV